MKTLRQLLGNKPQCFILLTHMLHSLTRILNHLSRLRAAAHQLSQDKHQDMRQKKRQKLTSASWLKPVCDGFHNLIRFNCAPFFASCRRYRVLIVTCLDACRCAACLTVFRLSAQAHADPSVCCWLNLWTKHKLRSWCHSNKIIN
jgi:hypothetical protein